MNTNLSRKQRAFLAAYRQAGVMSHAFAAANVAKTSHYRWLESSPDYAAEFEDIREYLADELEREARSRAIEGMRQYKFHNGAPVLIACDEHHPEAKRHQDVAGNVSYYRHYYEDNRSDTLLIFLLKAKRPKEFRENSHVHLEGDLTHHGSVAVYLPDNERDTPA